MQAYFFYLVIVVLIVALVIIESLIPVEAAMEEVKVKVKE